MVNPNGKIDTTIGTTVEQLTDRFNSPFSIVHFQALY